MASQKVTYNHYPLFTDRVVKAQRRINNLPKKQAAGVMKLMLDNPEFVNSLDALVMAMEHQLVQRGGRFVIPDAQLSERLSNIKLSSVTGEAWSWPYEFSIVSVPTRQRFAGKACEGIFVGWTNREDMETRYFPELLKAHRSSNHVWAAGSQGRLLEIIVPGEPDPRLPGGFPSVLRLSLSPDDIIKFINDEALERPSNTSFIMAEMNEEEASVMKAVTRYVLSLGMYISAYPDAVSSGVPDYMGNKHPGTQKVVRPRFVAIGQDRDQGLQDALSAPRHVPSHWRQLRHDKYYQGERKHQPRGTRYVLVSGYATGRDRVTGVEDLHEHDNEQ